MSNLSSDAPGYYCMVNGACLRFYWGLQCHKQGVLFWQNFDVTVPVALELFPCFVNASLNSSKYLYINQIATPFYLLLYLLCFSLKYSKCNGRSRRKSFLPKQPLTQAPCRRSLLWLQGLCQQGQNSCVGETLPPY